MKWWAWAATTVLFIGVMWLSTAPLWQSSYEESEAQALTPLQQQFAEAEGFDEVMTIVPGRCAMCHARDPGYEGIRRAPKDLLLETPHDVTRAARQIYLQAGLTHAMPPANVSFMEPQERQAIVDWYRDAIGEEPVQLAQN